MILDNLKQLTANKKALRNSQKEFKAVLKETYPHLEKVDLVDWINKTEKELEFLLSSAVRVKSGRVVIPLKTKDLYQNKLILTRSPGLKYPNLSYSCLEFREIHVVEMNGDIVSKTYYGGDKTRTIPLSILSNHEMINQETFQKFLELLKEFVAVKGNPSSKYSSNPEFLTPEDDETLKMEFGKININSKHFVVTLNKSKQKGTISLESDSLHEYHDHDGWGYDQATVEALELFIQKFSVIHKILLDADKKKEKRIEGYRILFQKLKTANHSFRVLNKLLKP